METNSKRRRLANDTSQIASWLDEILDDEDGVEEDFEESDCESEHTDHQSDTEQYSDTDAAPKIVCPIKAMYEDSELAVLHTGTISNAFSTDDAAKQDCLLSPLHFIMALEEVMYQYTTRQIEDLDFADDICLLSHKLIDMQAKPDELVMLAR
ncbi:uncharacterized protein LOC128854839 [Anastrepha ludens]|uniref:uncharacterized protein LOC128854839 n=1 Tax=Anastrepha ludens TaxID=28586 RepID=UPI0023AED95C|nr:uncharacterized protein LOC128854839 [Anastrepha ludens]